MTHGEQRQYFYAQLTTHYAQGELQSIYHWCAQELEGWSRAQAYTHNEDEVSAAQSNRWNAVVERLKKYEPVQYIFQKAHFFDMTLYVDPSVLIPRPETEELVQLVLDRHMNAPLGLLDIGTGSGCIALALKKRRTDWRVQGCDVSDPALEVARRNARVKQLDVTFFQTDLSGNDCKLPSVNVIVSNPPYIPKNRGLTLEANVLNHEPHLALFAPEDAPFFFFERIAEEAERMQCSTVYFETHATENHHLETALRSCWKGQISWERDLAGKERFLVLQR